MVKSKQNEFLYTALIGVFLLTSYTSIYGLKTRNIIHPSAINSLILSSYVGFIACTAAIITLSIYNVYKATNHKNYNITSKKAAHSNTLQVVQKSNYMESTSSTDSDFLDGDLIQLSESTSGINSSTSPLHEETSSASQIKLRQPSSSKIENTNKGMLLNLTSPLTPTVLTPFSTCHKPLNSDLKVKEVKVGNKVREDLDNLIPSDLINGISSTTSNQPQCVPVPPPVPTGFSSMLKMNGNLKSVQPQNTSHNQNKSAIPKMSLLDLGLKVKDTKISDSDRDLYNKIDKFEQSPNTAEAVLPPALFLSEHEEHSNISQQPSESKLDNSDSKVEDVKEDIKSGLISPLVPVQSQNTSNNHEFIPPPPPPPPMLIEPSNISQQPPKSKPCDQSRAASFNVIKRLSKENLKECKKAPPHGALANNMLALELFAKVQKRRKANHHSDPDSDPDSDSDKNEWDDKPKKKLRSPDLEKVDGNLKKS